jgi:hypothetical protein
LARASFWSRDARLTVVDISSLCAVADLQVQQQSKRVCETEQLDLLAVAVSSTGVARRASEDGCVLCCQKQERPRIYRRRCATKHRPGNGNPTNQTIGGRGKGRGGEKRRAVRTLFCSPCTFQGRPHLSIPGRETKETGVACDTMRVGLYCSLYYFIWASVC